MNNQPKPVSDTDLLLASGGGLTSDVLGRALAAFGKVPGEAVGPAIDGFVVYEDVKETHVYEHQAAQSQANQAKYQSDVSALKGATTDLQSLGKQYDSLDTQILAAKAQIGEDHWPEFVEFVNSGQWQKG